MRYDVRTCLDCKGRHVHYEDGGVFHCVHCVKMDKEWKIALHNYNDWLRNRSYDELVDVATSVIAELNKRANEYDTHDTVKRLEDFVNEME